MSSQQPSGIGTGTRGPLPPGVYWRRRVFVLGVAFALVFVLARWLGGSSDGSSDETPAAEQAGSRVDATGTVTAGESEATATAKAGKKKPKLAAPEGTCEESDIAITPSVQKKPEAGRDVKLRLSLQTLTSEACTWEVSRSKLVVRITQDGKPVWSTQQCPGAVPEESVVVRRGVATVVKLTWAEARESRARCTKRTDWAMPGEYTITAAALGGEPAEADFKLRKPVAETIPADPSGTADADKNKKKDTKKSDKKTKKNR